MPQNFITRAVFDAVRMLPRYPELSILDLSCGEGELLSLLANEGCAVRGTHFRSEDYIVENRERLATIPITDGVDLQRPIPLPDASYDVVIMTEVLEHLESCYHVVREARRLLRPGGYLVFTTPNVYRLHSRCQFFLTGRHKLIRRPVGWDLKPEDLYAYHISPLDFPLFHTLLHQQGLVLEKLLFTRVKWRSFLYVWLWPIVRIAAWLSTDKEAWRSAEFLRGERDLQRWLASPQLLFSEQLFGIARVQSDTRMPISSVQ